MGQLLVRVASSIGQLWANGMLTLSQIPVMCWPMPIRACAVCGSVPSQARVKYGSITGQPWVACESSAS
eukprot:8736538-Lingulodinium_polyedra.AAC.1